MKRLALAALFVAAGPLLAQQQPKPETPSQPKTKLEAFENQIGSVIIRGFAPMGTVRGVYGGTVTIEGREFTNATTGKKEYGVVVEVKETGRLEREDRSYVDYDEIEPLIRGMDYISKVDSSYTKLPNFQADYHTRGDLTISTFGSSAGVKAAVASGRIGSVDVIIGMAELKSLREIISQAKTELDGLRAP